MTRPDRSPGWRGYRTDATGFILMGDRYYDPIAGRFISPDPLGHEASMDLYSYAGGDPVNFVDPTGRGADGVVETVYSYTINADGTVSMHIEGMPPHLPPARYGDPHFEQWEDKAFRQMGVTPLGGEPANSALVAGSVVGIYVAAPRVLAWGDDLLTKLIPRSTSSAPSTLK